MSLEQQALAMAIQIGKDVQELSNTIGNPAELNTNSKTLGGAIKELQDELNSLSDPNAIIEQ